MAWKKILKVFNELIANLRRGRNTEDSEFQHRSSKTSDEDTIQLIIGLDFGTCFTKVVIGEARVRYAIPFDGLASLKNPYLIPSVLHVRSGTNVCKLSAETQHDALVRDLKMPLINRNWSLDDRARASAYLALVIRHARKWFLDTQGATYGNRKRKWFINVGLPTASFDDEELKSVYKSIVEAAWRASAQDEGITLDRMKQYILDEGGEIRGLQVDNEAFELPSDRINTFPEFAAQLSGYLRSSLRRNGLHVTVDVGGGTMDTTIFNVEEFDGEDTFPVLAREVRSLGVNHLATTRISRLAQLSEWRYSPFEDFPTNEFIQSNFNVDKERLDEVDLPIKIEVADAIRQLLRDTKSHRYPRAPQWSRDSSEFGNPVRSFYSGGGSLADFYANLLRRFEREVPPCRLRESRLPIPDDFQFTSDLSAGFDRMAVAYGLSYDPFDIGRIVGFDDIKDLEQEDAKSTFRDKFVGKEMV